MRYSSAAGGVTRHTVTTALHFSFGKAIADFMMAITPSWPALTTLSLMVGAHGTLSGARLSGPAIAAQSLVCQRHVRMDDAIQ